MSNHWQGRSYQVYHPKDRPRFYRLVRALKIDPDDFRSDWEMGWERQVGEDICRYRGISVWESLEQAIEGGADTNERIAARGGDPFAGVAEVELDWNLGHACARTGRQDGHHTVWGELNDLASSVKRVFTMEGDEA